MKYESNILERLIKTYGVVGNPKYVSEIIKQFIIQGKECYPNLFTYQSDWLSHIDEFGLANDYVVTYTGQRFYAPNTKESSVKRAILSGKTLVNLWGQAQEDFFLDGKGSFDNGVVTASGWCCSKRLELFKPNTEYTLITKVISVSDSNTCFIANNASNGIFKTETKRLTSEGIYVEKVLSISDLTKGYFSARSVVMGGGTVKYSMIILEGDHTQSPPVDYFEGMQSVKMPFLTTSNEDGTKTNILTVNEDITLRSNGSVYDELDLLTGELTQRIDENGEVLSQEVVKTVDLNIKDQDNQVVNHLTSFEGGTHFDTSSQTGSVLPTLEVDVVVDLEETLMVCSTEGNTM